MATKRKGRCVYTMFDKETLCAGTLDDILTVKTRTQQGTNPGHTYQPSEQFTTVGVYDGYLERVRPTRRWNGVSMVDQSAENYTHVGYIAYDDTVYELDINRCYVEVEGPSGKTRRFKLKYAPEAYGTDDEWMILRLAETGFTENAASEG